MSYHYKAFISYKHDPVDSEVAAQIQTRLERFHIPYALRKEKGIRNLRPVFRDKEELAATDDLNDTIKNALLESEYLIVICSTRSIESIWVQKEIGFFLQHHDVSKVLTVLVDGEPDQVIPKVLLEKEVTTVDENGEKVTVIEPLEPLSCDYRMERRRAAREEFPRLAAALIGCRYNDLRQRQRQYQMRMMGAGIAALTVLTLYFVWSNFQISANLKQSQISQSRNLANMSTASLDENDRLTAAGYALEALPDAEEDRPVIYEAAYALSRAVGAYNFPDTLDIENTAFLPAKYKAKAFKVSDDGRYVAMQDGDGLLRFWDIQTMEETGQVRPGEDISLLKVTDGNTLLVTDGNKLSAVNMKTAEVLWSQTYEQEILGLSALGEPESKQPVIALVFKDHVLAVASDDHRILGRYNSGSPDAPFLFVPDHPFVVSQYYFGEDQSGHALFADSETGKLYVISRKGINEGINGILVLDAKDLTSDFYPMNLEYTDQYAVTADQTGVYLICEKEVEGLNTIVTNNARRTDWLMAKENHVTVLKADLKGNVVWETSVPYTGTDMLGKKALTPFAGALFESTAKEPKILGAAFSNRITWLDMDSGEILGSAAAQNEITNYLITADNMGAFASTIGGSLELFDPERICFTAYHVFKEGVCRSEIYNTEVYDGSMAFYLLYSDGIRIYATNRGDEEYTAFRGEFTGSDLSHGFLSGLKYCVCSMGSQELAVLDLENNTSAIRSYESMDIRNNPKLVYMDPDESFVIVSADDAQGSVFKKIDLKDLSFEDIAGPGMRKDDQAFSYSAKEVVCAGNKILYFAIKSGHGVRRPFCMCVYDISSGEWKIHDLDFEMLNLFLRPAVSGDGQTVVMADQWGNGYLIRTEDGEVTALTDKIPAWTDCCWDEKGSSFAVSIDGADKEQIAAFSAQGRELFRVGKEYVRPLSMTYRDGSLWVLYEDYEVRQYDEKTGNLLQSINAAMRGEALDQNIHWDFTGDGQLLLNLGNMIAQIDLKLGGMTAEIPNGVGYISSLDRLLVLNTEKKNGDDRAFVSYPRYTVQDLIRKGKELTNKAGSQ